MIRSFFKYKLQNAVIRLGVGLEKCKGRIAQASLPEFGNKPENLIIELPRRIIHPEYMIIGSPWRHVLEKHFKPFLRKIKNRVWD